MNEILKAIAALTAKVDALDKKEADRYAAYAGWRDQVVAAVRAGAVK